MIRLSSLRPGLFRRIAACVTLMLSASAPIRAEPFTTITMIAASPAGGTYDATARLLARHLGKTLPGAPRIIVQNMPAAGGLVALNQLYNQSPRDGSVLAVVDGALIFEALFGNSAVRFDPKQFNWIGSRAKETPLCAARSDKSIGTIEEAMRKETIVGGVGGARTDNVPRMLNAIIGTKFKVVTGYPGSSELIGALERGEIDAICGWSWTTIKRRVPHWLRENKIDLLVQTGFAKAPDLPQVPLALDLVRADADRSIMRFLISDVLIASPLLAPPGLPASRVVELRDAFDTAMRDPQLLADAQQQQIDIDPTGGAEIQAIVSSMFSLPRDLALVAKNMIGR